MYYVIVNPYTGTKGTSRVFTDKEQAESFARGLTKDEKEIAKAKGLPTKEIKYIAEESDSSGNAINEFYKTPSSVVPTLESGTVILPLESKETAYERVKKKYLPEKEESPVIPETDPEIKEVINVPFTVDRIPKKDYRKPKKEQDKRFKEKPLDTRLNLLINHIDKELLLKIAKKKDISVNQLILNLVEDEIKKGK